MLSYLFVDMNAYFASVEQQDNPALRGLPIGVIPMRADTTCCIAASYEAKRFGVKTGTGVKEARGLCPHIRLVVARPKRYVQVHHQIVQAVESCLHVQEVCSIDEMYGRLMGHERLPVHARKIGESVKDTIKRDVGEYLLCSVGLAANPWLAKVASDLRKPDGLTALLQDDLPYAISHLKLTDLPGIAKRMQRRLKRHRVRLVSELYDLSERELAQVWGSKVMGSIWWHQLRGHALPSRPTRRRTVGHSHVLPPSLRTDEAAYAVVCRMIHKAAARMRALRYRAQSLTASVRYMDRRRWVRKTPLGLCRDTQTMLQAFHGLWLKKRVMGTPLKVSVVLTHLIADQCSEAPLFAGAQQREALADVMDRIDQKHGRHAIYFASMFGVQDSAPARIAFTQIPKLKEF